jgi:type IV secretory pathway VirB10-like protein
MISRKKEIRFRQKQRQANKATEQAGLSFFSKLTQRLPAKIGGVALSALIVLHFVSQFIFFQNEIIPDEITALQIENEQIVEIKREYEPVKSDVVTMLEPIAPPPIAQPERKASALPKTVKRKQPRAAKTERPRRADRIERVFHTNEIASVFPYGRVVYR